MINAVDYLKEKKRMCNFYSPSCERCPLFGCSELEVTDPQEYVDLVESWKKQHPVKKYFNLQKCITSTIEAGIEDDSLLEILGENGWARECIGKEVINNRAVGTVYGIEDSWCVEVGDGVEDE